MTSTTDDFNAISNTLQLTVFERGWLSSNGVLFQSAEANCLVDTGYATHSAQTLALVKSVLGQQPLQSVINTHLHSDHCGGNAALASAYPELHIRIPPGQAEAVAAWDTDALSYGPTGQTCPRFHFTSTVCPGETLVLGSWPWEVHAAKGHDPHSIVLFQPDQRVLLSADALWENGFGVVFPELDGIDAFEEVADTLELIESLNPSYIVPGHGTVFTDLQGALARARSRLAQFQAFPEKHRRYAVKVLLKFKLLEWQETTMPQLIAWFQETPYFNTIAPSDGMNTRQASGVADYLRGLLQELQKAGAIEVVGECIRNR